MKRAGPLLLLFLLPFSGCVTETDSNGSQNELDCTRTYSLDCDDNQDALALMELYEINQITNTTTNIGGPNLDGSWITWTGGGFGEQGYTHAFDIEHQAHFFIENPWDSDTRVSEYTLHRPRASQDGILFGRTPAATTPDDNQDVLLGNTAIYVWHPSDGHMTQIPKEQGRPFLPRDFDGEWIIVREHFDRDSEDGLSAIHAETGEEVVLYAGGEPYSGTYFKQPFVAQKVSSGSAIVSYAREDRGIRFDVSLVEYELATGEQRFLLDYEGPPLHEFDVNPEYVVTSGFSNSLGYTLNIYSRANQTWWHPVVPDGAAAGSPRVGGDWIVYIESYTDSQAQPNLRAFHVPTQTYHTLIDTQPGMHLIEWDTDGQSVMVKLALTTGRILPWLYEGEQLYWMPLPEVGS